MERQKRDVPCAVGNDTCDVFCKAKGRLNGTCLLNDDDGEQECQCSTETASRR